MAAALYFKVKSICLSTISN